MVAKADVMMAAANEMAGLWRAVDPQDRERFGCRWFNRQDRLLHRGEFDARAARADAERVGRKAVNARDWAAFFDKAIAFFMKIAPLFIKA